jgi:hypothetical protein
MNTGKALIAGIVVTLALLAFSYGAEGLSQLAGPEEQEEVVESEESETVGEDEADDVEVDHGTDEDEDHGEDEG